MKKKIILALALVTTFGMTSNLVGCTTTTGDSSSSATSSSTSQVTKAVKSITIDQTKYPETGFYAGVDYDFKNYITVTYEDNTTSHDFTIASGEGFTVTEDNVVTFEQPGTFNLRVSAGAKRTTASIEVSTQELDDFREFWDSLKQNYTIWEITSDGTNLYKEGFSVHSDNNYVAEYLPNGGNPLEYVFTKLNDGNYYEGTFKTTPDVDESTGKLKDFDIQYKPGIKSWTDYVFSYSLSDFVPSSSFTQTVDSYGDVAFVCNNTQYAAFFLTLTLGVSYGVDPVSITVYMDGYGTAEELNPLVILTLPNNGGSVAFGIEDVGTSTNAGMEADMKDPDVIPEPIKTDKLATRYSNLTTGKNYTMQVDTKLLSSYGEELTSEQYAAYDAYWQDEYKGWGKDSYKALVTEDSIAYVPNDGSEPTNGYLNNNGKVYSFATGEDSTKTATEVSGASDIWTYAETSKLTTKATIGLDNLVFDSYTSEKGVETYTSDAGDNTNSGNTTQFTASFLDQYATNTKLSAMFKGDLANALTEALPFTNNETHALCINADFKFVLTDDSLAVTFTWSLATAGLDGATCGQQAGISDTSTASYLEITYTYTDIGTTVAPDLSSFIETIGQ